MLPVQRCGRRDPHLTTDAKIAAHALEFDAVVVTRDTDFGRFPGVRVFDPLR